MADPAGSASQGQLLIGAHTTESSLQALAARLGELAAERAVTVGTAESCTGGLVGHGITSVPGSSAYYVGGVVAYADATKVDLVGVPEATIERHGAVSAQVAVAMAEGVRERLGCDVAVAVTGVAGPDGGTEAKPVGLTYVATASAGGHEVRRHHWSGDRAGNKLQSARAALEMLIETIETGLSGGANPANGSGGAGNQQASAPRGDRGTADEAPSGS